MRVQGSPSLSALALCAAWVALTATIATTACSKQPEAGPEPKAAPAAEVSLPGVDTSALTPRERRDWASQVSELLAPCADVPVNIAQCVTEKRACKTCLPAAQFLLKQVQAGRAKKEREDAFHARFDQGKTKTIVTGGSPEIGSPDAVVTIVEWADFECPHCRDFYPLFDEIVHKNSSQVRLVFKFYPLGAHPHGELAARAAAAAMRQGKFWQMHHMLFDNQQHLEQSDLEGYAKSVGLDLAKFRSDFGSKEVTEILEKDKKQAEELGFDGTPFIFINGRNVVLQNLTSGEDVSDWVKLDIELASGSGEHGKGAPQAPPVASGSAAPAPSASASAGTPKK